MKNKQKPALFEVDWLHEQSALNDPNKEFGDLGEFEYRNKSMKGEKTILVHFETMADFEEFVKVTKLPIGKKVKWTWYPYKKRTRYPDIHEGHK